MGQRQTRLFWFEICFRKKMANATGILSKLSGVNFSLDLAISFLSRREFFIHGIYRRSMVYNRNY